MGNHAKLSPSSAVRWINCPGSILLSEQCPDPGTNEYAEEGTIAHELAEIKLRAYLEPTGKPSPLMEKSLARLKKTEFYCGEMEEATDFYYDIVTEKLLEGGAAAELMVEQRFSLEQWVPESFGTADAVIISDGTIEVCDLKYGKGVKVSAKGNPQLRLYGLGAAWLFGDLYDFDTVRVTIIQPRLDHVSTEEISLKDLQAWADTIVKPKAQAAIDGTGETAAGEWCRFCPAKAVCRKRAEENLELAKMDFRDPELLSDEEIGKVLRQAEELSKWTSDVQAYALEQALAGKHFDGWKVVEGRSIRKYADELKVADALKAAGYDEAMLFERKLYGITAMEKIVGKKKFAEVLGELVVKPAGKPTLAPESDKRAAINTNEAARADFQD